MNLTLFLPLGIALRRVGTSRALVAGALLSGAVETLQVIIPGRHPALADLVANIGGTVLGTWVPAWPACLTWLRRTRHWLAPVATVLGLGICLLQQHLFRFAPPPSPRVRFAPTTSRLVPFRGIVDSVRVNGRVVANGMVVDRRPEATAESLHVEVRARIMAPETRPASVVRAASGAGDWFLLMQRGSGFLFDVRSRALADGLGSAAVRVEGFVTDDGRAHDLRLKMGATNRRLWLEACELHPNPHCTRRETRLGPADTWQLMSPAWYPPPPWDTLAAGGWLYLLLAPGFLVASLAGARRAIVTALVLAIGVGGASVAGIIEAPTPAESLVAAVCCAVSFRLVRAVVPD